MHNLDYQKQAFNSVGWFIPPYVSMGFIDFVVKQIVDANNTFGQQKLEQVLSYIYSAENLSAMVSGRYPDVKYVSNYKKIISEAVTAHFLGLDHIAVAGLVPVVEGAGEKIAHSMGVAITGSSTNLFLNLAEYCKKQTIEKNIGAVGEIISMMDSFIQFTKDYLYINSKLYPLNDKTNRHGIVHGAYSDADYGTPINFYKCIAAIDFLCLISGFSTGYTPCFAPDKTEASRKLAAYYGMCSLLSQNSPKTDSDY